MAEEKTYLELSEKTSHKFYEITLNGTQLFVRYGRIGDPGQNQTSSFPTTEKARQEAQKKINEKLKKGYTQAIEGVRKKRPVTRRIIEEDSTTNTITSSKKRSSSNTVNTIPAPDVVVKNNPAPLLWKFDTRASALGIFVSNNLCWVGNEAGKIFALNHNGEIHAKFKLPEGVKCIVADTDWLYAGCDDGNVYDLSGKTPRIAYEIAENVDIYWIDIWDAILTVADANGNVTTFNHEDESQWTKKSSGYRGWMVRCDEIGIYHGHSKGVTMYDWEDGKFIWEKSSDGMVNFGWQEESAVYACTDKGKIHAFSKKGELLHTYVCDRTIYSCATAENGKYVFAGDLNSIYCFSEDGTRLWKLATECGAPQSMQFYQDRLYIVTHHGFLACVDVSESAIALAQKGSLPKTTTFTAPAVTEISATSLETTSDQSRGIMVECFRQGKDLRMRVISAGYNHNWNCQFPKGIRQEGARYLVDEIRQSKNGSFYRAFGNIRKLSN
ncbi:MAG: WGR domain-containing protein [Acidobacteria bacterium]|nr:WGR domain-containing protein [Acidobacteriota bacterium]